MHLALSFATQSAVMALISGHAPMTSLSTASRVVLLAVLAAAAGLCCLLAVRLAKGAVEWTSAALRWDAARRQSRQQRAAELRGALAQLDSAFGDLSRQLQFHAPGGQNAIHDYGRMLAAFRSGTERNLGGCRNQDVAPASVCVDPSRGTLTRDGRDTEPPTG